MAEANCPRCGGLMVVRIAKRGQNSGQRFLGCSNFPKCTTTMPIDNNFSLEPSPKPVIDPAKPSIIRHTEFNNLSFEGTVVDIETDGEFDRKYDRADSRFFQNLKQVAFGYVDNQKLEILCANGEEAIKLLNEEVKELIPKLKRPLYAFNCQFERGVWFHQLNIAMYVDNELQQRFEKKEDVVRALKLPQYDDPFQGNGLLCMKAWQKGEHSQVILHNRACLLKERDILISRGCCSPEELRFTNI